MKRFGVFEQRSISSSNLLRNIKCTVYLGALKLIFYTFYELVTFHLQIPSQLQFICILLFSMFLEIALQFPCSQSEVPMSVCSGVIYEAWG